MNYLYSLTHPQTEHDLCELEIRSLFGENFQGDTFFSPQKINPSLSPYLSFRFEPFLKSETFSDLLKLLEGEKLSFTSYRVEYIKTDEPRPSYKERCKKSREIGLLIQGKMELKKPETIIGFIFLEENWYLGVVEYNKKNWLYHQKKPVSYSNSLDQNMAKALVNIAGKGDLSKKLVDPCCGVGTVLLEALYGGYSIEGFDIGPKVASNARKNLRFFGYPSPVEAKNIKDITDSYDVAIVDLPYGHFSATTEQTLDLIINKTKDIAPRVIFISSINMEEKLLRANFTILDKAIVQKSINFKRTIWVCQSPFL